MDMKQLKKFVNGAEEAVSPVVATLMLVLVAAGAAVGVSVFMGAFQDETQANADASTAGKQVLTIGGSSTVFEFSQVAIPEFEKAFPQIIVELQSGGSGAGRDGVCLGVVDIGAASSPVRESHQDKCEDLSGGERMEVFKVATDGVVFVVDPSNDACDNPATANTVEVAALTQAEAYSLYYHNSNGLYGSHKTGADAPAAPTDDLDGNGAVAVTNAPNQVQWGEIPNTAGGFCEYGTGTADLDDPVEIFDRQDPGGTSEIANEKLFGGDGKQIEDLGIVLNEGHQGDGNQGVGDKAEGKPGAIWFTSFGYAEAQGWTVAAFGIDNTPIVPDGGDIQDEVYEATRPINYMTLGAPSPLEKQFLDFVMGPHNNQLFADGADFESLY